MLTTTLLTLAAIGGPLNVSALSCGPIPALPVVAAIPDPTDDCSASIVVSEEPFDGFHIYDLQTLGSTHLFLMELPPPSTTISLLVEVTKFTHGSCDPWRVACQVAIEMDLINLPAGWSIETELNKLVRTAGNPPGLAWSEVPYADWTESGTYDLGTQVSGCGEMLLLSLKPKFGSGAGTIYGPEVRVQMLCEICTGNY